MASLVFNCIVVVLFDGSSLSRLLDKAKEIATKVGGEAITLAELENFYPEDGMILANTTSVGMKPRADDTPIPKVWSHQIFPKHSYHSFKLPTIFFNFL